MQIQISGTDGQRINLVTKIPYDIVRLVDILQDGQSIIFFDADLDFIEKFCRMKNARGVTSQIEGALNSLKFTKGAVK